MGTEPTHEAGDHKLGEWPHQADPQDVEDGMEQGEQHRGVALHLQDLRKNGQGMKEKREQQESHDAGCQVEDDVGGGNPFGVGGGAHCRQGRGRGRTDVGADDQGGSAVKRDKASGGGGEGYGNGRTGGLHRHGQQNAEDQEGEMTSHAAA